MSTRAEKVALMLLVVGLLNFALFVTGSIALGGDAVNGKIEDGQILSLRALRRSPNFAPMETTLNSTALMAPQDHRTYHWTITC